MAQYSKLVVKGGREPKQYSTTRGIARHLAESNTPRNTLITRHVT